MTLATSHGSAARPKASRVTKASSVASSMALDRNGCVARLVDTAWTRTPLGAASRPALLRRVGRSTRVLVADGERRPLLDASLGGGQADTGARGGGDEQRLAGEQAVALRVRGDIGHVAAFGFGSDGSPSARSPTMFF